MYDLGGLPMRCPTDRRLRPGRQRRRL